MPILKQRYQYNRKNTKPLSKLDSSDVSSELKRIAIKIQHTNLSKLLQNRLRLSVSAVYRSQSFSDVDTTEKLKPYKN